MTEQELLKMQVGDTLFNPRIGHIHRVVGGWVYQFVSGGVFVPLPPIPCTYSDNIQTKAEQAESESTGEAEQAGKKRGRKPVLTK